MSSFYLDRNVMDRGRYYSASIIARPIADSLHLELDLVPIA